MNLDSQKKLWDDIRMLEQMLLIHSDKYPRVYFRNEKARFWADNTRLSGETCTQYIARLSNANDKNYLIIHPEEDSEDVPFDYDGKVIQFLKDHNVSLLN